MKTIYEFLLKSKTATSTQHTDCVDFGLPSGLLWARCNIGAYEPYECGDYFMWGSTVPNTDKYCDWTHAPFNDKNYVFNGDYFKSIRNNILKNDVLSPEYDAATVILGEGWRLPTEDEFQELIDNTEYGWVKNYKGSDANGMIFRSKNGEAANANDADMFIPASGYRDGSNFYNRGTCANLWSSSLDEGNPVANSAYYLRLNNFDCCYVGFYTRHCGFCLRGVREK